MSPRFVAALLALLLTLPALAATRLTYDINGVPTPILWAPTDFPLPYQVDRRLIDANPKVALMIDRAFANWSAIPAARVTFDRRENSEPRARSDAKISITMAEELFKDQGALAMTTYTFDRSTGQFTDADILVDPSLLEGKFNLQMALEHEVGHALGLDHSGVISSVMYPFVSGGDYAAAFDSDDRIAIAATYPKSDPTLTGATLTGKVLGDSGGIFGAQVVAVNERGEPVSTDLTNTNGEFTLTGIPNGHYRLYAEPLDGPVDANSLRGSWRNAEMKTFPTQFFGGAPIQVESGKVYGNLVLSTAGAVQLNPKWIGACAANSHTLSLSSTPATVKPGDTIRLAVGGDGFTSSMTEFEVLNPAFRRVSDFEWSSNFVTAQFAVEPNAQAGSAVVLVRSGNETATLTGALRIHRPAVSKGRAARH
jgi:hypothetical protein